MMPSHKSRPAPRLGYPTSLILLGLISLARTAECDSLETRAPRELPILASFERTGTSTQAPYIWRSSTASAKLSQGGKLSIQFPNGTQIAITFVAANSASEPKGESSADRKSLYYLGPANNWTSTSHFERVRYKEIYPGIDVVFITSAGQLEYNFEIAPYADPSAIRVRYDGGNVALEPNGDLRISAAGANINQRRPQAFQSEAGQARQAGEASTHAIACDYHLSNREVSLHPRRYDRNLPLVIDPVLIFSTYVGGLSYDAIYAMTIDSSGNLYVTGETASANLWSNASPNRSSRDVFVVKLNASATQVFYTVYLGGSGADSGRGIAVDTSGNVYITGATNSVDFPVTSGAFSTQAPGAGDAFVAKLDPRGCLLYSTYLGGQQLDSGLAIAVDASGDAFVAGQTESTTFATTANALQPAYDGGMSDCFVSKLNPTGTALIYSTFLGGTSLDLCSSIALDPAGNAYLAGTTYSPDFPTLGALQTSLQGTANAFVAKINPSGTALVISTFLGGSGMDAGNAITLDSSGAMYVAGNTSSVDFPITSSAAQNTLNGNYNAFVSKLSADGSTLIYSTFLGGSHSDTATSIAVDPTGEAVLGGYTTSPDFPIAGAAQSSFQGDFDAFASVLAPNGASLVFSSLFGGSGDDRGYALTVTAASTLYLAGMTSSTNFPTASAIQPALNGSYDAFVLEANYASAPAVMSSPTPGSTLAGASVTFQWTAGTQVSQYWLYVSKVAAGGSELFSSSQSTQLSQTVSGLPTDGSTLYVRLWSLIGATSVFNDYTYKAVTVVTPVPAVMSSPAPGSTLSGSSATFQWTAGTGVSQYWLYVSKIAVGGSELFSSSQSTQLSQTVNGLPTNGSTLYVRLWSLIGTTSAFNDYTYKAVTVVSSGPAAMSNPAPGSTLSSSSVTFQWTTGSGVTQYWLYVSKLAVGGTDLCNLNENTQLSQAVSGLPTDGSALYVRLWSLMGGNWVYNDYTYKAGTVVSSTPAVMSSPAPGSTLAGASATFQWTPGTGVSQYWLYVSKIAIGGSELFSSSASTQLSQTVNGLPTDGSTLYVRLWSLIGSTSQFNDYTYKANTAVSSGPAAMSSPTPGSTLSGSTVTFQWIPGAGVSQYWLYVSKVAAGGTDLLNSNENTQLSQTVSGLPTDGSTVYVRLWSLTGATWTYSDYTYKTGSTVSSAPAAMSSPTPGSTLSGSSVTFQWTPGTGVSQYQLYVSKLAVGGSELFSSSPSTQLFQTVSGLPTDGSTLYVRLWSFIGSTSVSNDYTYKAYTAVSSGPAAMSNPAPGSTLSSSSVTFQWTPGTGVTEYWLYVSKLAVGGTDLYNSNESAQLSQTVSGLPTDGSTVYVRLWSLSGATWTFSDYTYKTGSTASPTPAVMSSPAPGSTLSGSSATFQWTPGTGVSQYWLYVSKLAVGGSELFSSSPTTLLSQTVSGLPTDGSTLYVRLWSMIGATSVSNDYTYKAATVVSSGPAVMSSPAPGSTLSGSSVTFQWTPGAGATQYWLYGSRLAPGGTDLFTLNENTQLSQTIGGLPTDGSTLYIRLFSLIGSTWLFNDYTYKAFP
jgi:beta-propeller repeat-containing protein